MAQEPLLSLLRGLRRLSEHSGGTLTDAELLERFIRQRDEAAFEVLVWRHGPLVLGVCRRLLHREQDVEDAFQATFLALVRRAHTIVRREAVAAWLYRVAYRVALAARKSAADRAAKEQPWTEQAAEDQDELLWRELRPILDAEVMRLPEKYRAPFVLCCLEGKTNEEAAALLGCPRGTIQSRLARARERLRCRLARRGVTLSAAALGTATAAKSLAALPVGLAEMTIRAVPASTASVSTRVAALAEGVLRVMFVNRLKPVLLVVLMLAFTGAGAGLLAAGMLPGEPGKEPPAGASTPLPGGAAAAPAKGPRKKDPAEEARLRRKSANNLRQIGLALIINHDVVKGLTPAIYSKDGKPLLSWRVAILPYIEQTPLYNQFKLDEPWDSPHNKQLLARMPDLYAPVRGPSKVEGGTYYQGFVGKGAAFEPNRKLRIPADFPDGTSNIILAIEAAQPVPWTKPEDLPYVPDQALPQLGGQFHGHSLAVFVDSRVKLISRNADPDVLRLAITRNDGQPIDFDKVLAPQVRKGKVDLELLPEELERLKEVLKKARAEVKQARERVETLKAQLPRHPLPENKLLQEHAALRAELERTWKELRALQQEADRLQGKEPARKPMR
jgi:RNA polymerase sigma factor (sigma-70 family)